MLMTDKEIFDKVLTIGPDIKGYGGIASVLQIYRRELPSFHYLRSNSRFGTVAGAFSLMALMCRLPFARLKGRRILHVHTAAGKSFIRKSWIMSWGRFWGYKTIYHCHGAESKKYFERRGINNIRSILDRCSANIVLSQTWADYFTDIVGAEHVHVVHNIALPTGTAPKKPYSGVLRLLFMGAIGNRKGIFDLLDTIGANAAQWRGRIHLTVGGDGEMERFHDTVAGYGISDMVTYIGWATGEKKDLAFKSADIAILPSYNEGLPVFILEAMADGLPVISTCVGGIPDAVDDSNGILTEPGDKKAITDAINHYLTAPEDIEKHGRNSLSKINPYLPASVVSTLGNIYRTLDQ